MKSITIIILLLSTLFTLFSDKVIIEPMRREYKILEKERIDIINKLSTAQIVQENMVNVEKLIRANIYTNPTLKKLDTDFYLFITDALRDLRIDLLAVAPATPKEEGRYRVNPYRIDIETDFFSFGELCSKIENSHRIISIREFSLHQSNDSSTDNRQKIRASLLIDSYTINNGVIK